jgi:Ala-tRNA(Pro) deacylase
MESGASADAEAAVDESVHEKVLERLTEAGVAYRLVEHRAAETSRDAAEIRGSRLEQGAKALVLRSKGEFMLFVVSAARELDPKKLRAELKLKSLSFATADEVLRTFRLLKGSVPPLGSILGMRTIADVSLKENDEIVFNAGLRTRSVFLSLADYDAIEKPTWVDCSADGA